MQLNDNDILEVALQVSDCPLLLRSYHPIAANQTGGIALETGSFFTLRHSTALHTWYSCDFSDVLVNC